MADEQHDPTQPLDPTQPASSIPAGSPTADQPPAEPTDAGSSAPPFVQNPQAPVPNSSAPGATAEPATILKADPPAAPETTTVQPVHVDQRTRRSDDDALEGHFVDIIDGDDKGRRGTFDRVTEYGTDGYPKRILVITRDERNEPLDVPYEYARPTTYLGGR